MICKSGMKKIALTESNGGQQDITRRDIAKKEAVLQRI